MPSQPSTRPAWIAGVRNIVALLALLAGVALFAAVSFASAPSKLPPQAKVAGGGTPSASPTNCPQHWEVVYSPNPLNYEDQLYGAAAISSSDMWAVGSSGTALTEHWDGSAWGVVTSTIAMSVSVLYDVTAPSTSDAWAVGAYSPDKYQPLQALILHWDGALWDLMPIPSTLPESYIYGVEAISANDIWAVGTQNNNTQTLAMHWNGTAWNIVPTPNPGTSTNILKHASALATNDVWAVGHTDQGASLILHWNGTAWANVPIGLQGALNDVLALSPNNVWAVGDGLILHWNGSIWTSYPGAPGVLESLAATSPDNIWAAGTTVPRSQTGLVMHWDGVAWSVVPSPEIPNQGGTFHAILALSSSEIWTVGEATRANNNHISTVTMHYHPDCPMPTECSTGWNVVRGAYPGLDGGVTFGVAAVSPHDVWAVGTGLEGPREQPLMEHWDGSYWSSVPGPSIPVNANLNAVSAISANDVWAVGLIYTSGISLEERLTEPGTSNSLEKAGQTKVPDAYGTLTMHWNGQAWSWIPSPGPQTYNGPLDAVDGAASNDVWAAGALSFLHWNGTAWTQFDLGLGQGEITSIAAIATNNVWAVGYIGDPGSWNGLIMHWDGVAWTRVASEILIGHVLNDISAVSANDIWATGDGIVINWNGSQWDLVQVPSNSPRNVTALTANDVWASASANMLHWDGTSWTVVPTPTPDPEASEYVMDMAAASSNEIWAVGYAFRPLTLLPRLERYVGSCQISSPTATPRLSPTPAGCAPTWTVVASPNKSPNNFFRRVAAVSASDVWAVGGYYDSVEGIDGTLAEHWNGTIWSVVPSPNVGISSFLWGVAAASTSDVWAVGSYRLDNSSANKTLVEHWDGTMWSIVSSPNQGSGGNYLNAVVVVSSSDVWAVGNAGAQTLTEHWDGTTWAIVPSLNGGSQNHLYGVAAVAANDVWAVGFIGTSETLVEHWDGTAWSIVPSPNPGSSANYLDSVAAVSTNDVWAVGYYENGAAQTLIEHWDGSTWSVVPSPNPGTTIDSLYAVAALSANDVWAVGLYQSSSENRTLVEHWDGTVWTVTSSYNVGTFATQLFGVAAISASQVWTVGDYLDGAGGDMTLTEYYDSCNLTPSPTSTPPSRPTNFTTPTGTATRTSTATPSATRTSTPVTTVTPGGPTATRTMPATAIATATTCPIQFTDVPEGSTFYPYIRCLACRGIISGYGDATFRPNNNVTRGQLSKIVANAAGFSDPQPTQMFEDVPLGSTFQVYIGRLAFRGYINGYPCGGSGEECVPPANLPYFRPFNNATRGQIAKIVSNAAGFIDPPGGQSFEDVPPGSTFYTYTERLVERSVMQGYQCGSAGEPCIPPTGRPYFRPFNNATRGQTSKIVANTFFPGCAP